MDIENTSSSSMNKRLEYKRNWRRKNLYKDLLDGAIRRSRKFNLPCDLVKEDIVVPSHCPILGIPLYKNKGKSQCNNSPTLDKINPNLGYTKDNIAVISFLANRQKGDLTWKQHLFYAWWGFKQDIKRQLRTGMWRVLNMARPQLKTLYVPSCNKSYSQG
jgi:hypothetical protein